MKNPFARKPQTDTEAFRIIYDMFYDRVYQTAYYITKDIYLAQDVLQDTFFKAFKHLDEVKDGSRMGAWLSVIATRTAIDLLRKNNRWNGIPTDDVLLEDTLSDQEEMTSSTELEVERLFRKDQVREQIAKLKLDYREVILLKYDHGLRDEEIASLLKTSVGTIKSRIYRAKQRIKKLILHDEHEVSRKAGDVQ